MAVLSVRMIGTPEVPPGSVATLGNVGQDWTTSEPFPYMFYEPNPHVWRSYGFLLLAVGTVGNAMTIVVILASKVLRTSTSSMYLISLAILDLLVLYTGLLARILLMGWRWKVMGITEVSCKFWKVWSYYSDQQESWILVQMSLERLIAVFWPHMYKRLYTRARAIIGLVISAVALMSLNLHWFWTAGMVTRYANKRELRYCDFPDWEKYGDFVEAVWVWVDLTVAAGLPFVIMLVVNVAIIVKVKCKGRGPGARARMTGMTLTLLAVTFTFLILTGPLSFFVALLPHRAVYHTMMHDAFILMFFTNYGINFFLYCVTAPRFRREFVRLWTKTKVHTSKIEKAESTV